MSFPSMTPKGVRRWIATEMENYQDLLDYVAMGDSYNRDHALLHLLCAVVERISEEPDTDAGDLCRSVMDAVRSYQAGGG